MATIAKYAKMKKKKKKKKHISEMKVNKSLKGLPYD